MSCPRFNRVALPRLHHCGISLGVAVDQSVTYAVTSGCIGPTSTPRPHPMRTRAVARAWVSGRPAALQLLAWSRRRLRFFWALDSISLAVAVTLASVATRRELPLSRVMKLRIAPQWRTARSGMRAVHPGGLSGLEASSGARSLWARSLSAAAFSLLAARFDSLSVCESRQRCWRARVATVLALAATSASIPARSRQNTFQTVRHWSSALQPSCCSALSSPGGP